MALFSSPSIASNSAFYFVDVLANKQSLYKNKDCRGELKPCVRFGKGKVCGIRLYAEPYSIKMANRSLKERGSFAVRYNSGNFDVFCKLGK